MMQFLGKDGQARAAGRAILGISLLLGASTAMAQQAVLAPENILPAQPAVPPQPATPTAPTAPATPGATPTGLPVAAPEAAPVGPAIDPVMTWMQSDAQALLAAIKRIGAHGLTPADYQPDELSAAIVAGPGAALDAQASRSFTWLVEDMRDGRTRMDARHQWFVVDPDVDAAPTETVMAQALMSGDIAGAIEALAPTHPDYAVLKATLAGTPAANKAMRATLRVNMDRWRWLPRDLGKAYLLTNVPEFQLRLTVDNEIIRSYRTIVGKPGRTATPQLAEVVEGVIFNPTWTVPQSIVKGEGLGAELVANPARAVRENYKVTKAKDGTIYVVQQPGPKNALGFMKLDMPNEHAIFLHDTPGRHLFAQPGRALSHGCVRTERALELAITMAILGGGLSKEEAVAVVKSATYTRVPMTRTFPVYLTYFTVASDINGKLGKFNDLYGRDGPVIEALNAPRKAWDGKRKSTEAIIQLDNPL